MKPANGNVVLDAQADRSELAVAEFICFGIRSSFSRRNTARQYSQRS